jgi:hypothetical protein
MVRSFGIQCVLVAGLMIGSVGGALALGLPVSPLQSAAGETQPISFFGRPYPFGYTGWGPCVRYVHVETSRGPRLRRVWVCR